MASASGLVGPTSDTSKHTDAVEGDDGTHLKNEYIARLCYEDDDFKRKIGLNAEGYHEPCAFYEGAQYGLMKFNKPLSADPKTSATSYNIPADKVFHFAVDRFLPPPTCPTIGPGTDGNDPRCSPYDWRPLNFQGSRPMIRIVIIPQFGSPSEYMFRDYYLDGPNFDVGEIPFAPGDKLEFYFIETSRDPRDFPPGSKIRAKVSTMGPADWLRDYSLGAIIWGKISVKKYQDFVDNDFNFYVGSIRIPPQKFERALDVGIPPLL